MIDTEQQAICKREGCNNPIEQKAIGPYKREYCGNACKQKAYRASHRNVIDEQSQQRITQLEQELAAANEMIDTLLSRKKTTTPLKRSYQERLTRKGEALDWPALEIRTTVKPGRKNWRVFMLNESNDQLIRAIIAAERLQDNRNQS